MPFFYKVEVRFPYIGASLPRDVAINTFHFLGGDAGDPEDQTALIVSALPTFYESVGTGATVPIVDFLSQVLSVEEDAVEIWGSLSTDLTLPNGGFTPKQQVGNFTIELVDTAALPNEVAVCMSLKDSTNTLTPGRHRGRNFIGPLNVAALGPNLENGMTTPDPDLIEAIQGAAQDLQAFVEASVEPSVSWCIYSRANEAYYRITNGWVDNEFDTQRRRQQRATLRNTFNMPAAP